MLFLEETKDTGMGGKVNQAIKNLAKRTFLNNVLVSIFLNINHKKEFLNWQRRGKPNPPPYSVKEAVVKGYAKKFSIDTFVETGTYFGDMVYAMKDTFNKIYSVELDDNVYKKAKERFARFPHIQIIQGDSGRALPNILSLITEPALFWLDAHYSGGITARGDLDTPIMKELQHIFNNSIHDHVILIDDARHFRGQNGYPTLKELQSFVFQRYPGSVFEVKNDIIRIYRED